MRSAEDVMKAVVVYESVWGNTAAIARAVADGIGPDAQVLATDAATPDFLASADLIVAGSPVFGFQLPTDAMRSNVARDEADAPTPPDLSHPSLRLWLETVPPGAAAFAAFETRIWWSPGGATGTIEDRLSHAGYRRIGKARKFIVKGKYGPLRDGEIERARRWGQELAEAVRVEGPALVGSGSR